MLNIDMYECNILNNFKLNTFVDTLVLELILLFI